MLFAENPDDCFRNRRPRQLFGKHAPEAVFHPPAPAGPGDDMVDAGVSGEAAAKNRGRSVKKRLPMKLKFYIKKSPALPSLSEIFQRDILSRHASSRCAPVKERSEEEAHKGERACRRQH